MSQNLEREFVDLLNEYQNLVHKICRIYTRDIDAHNDLFQEIAIQLWKSYPNYKGDAKFSTWAYRVALNTAISLFRKSTKEIQTSDVDFSSYQFSSNEYNDEEEQQLKLMYTAIHQLNDIDKALIFLYLEDKDYSEISDTLGISEVNVRVKMNRVKNKLKKTLNP
jgi:RNA polymerase sigma-70 factor, ECF subfamily